MQLRNTFFIETRLTSTYQAGKRAQRCEGMEYHDHTLSEREPRGSGNILPEIKKICITVNCGPIISFWRSPNLELDKEKN